MATDYKTILDRMLVILEAERTDKLSEDLSKDLQSIEQGQYVPADTGAKPMLRVRMAAAAIKRNMAGSLLRDERLKMLFSGAVHATTQKAAQDDATNLVNNLCHVLENYPSDTGYWSGGCLGWSAPDDDEAGDDYAAFEADPGANGCVVHFQVRWSCEVRIARESL